MNTRKHNTLFAALCLGTIPMTASAQPQDTLQQKAGTLEEVVVTAQKRAESLQETPLSVSAIDSNAIEQRGIIDVGDLGSAAPNLVVSENPAATANPAIYIRGIGESDPILTADSPVGLYIDGVIIGRAAGSLFDMVDLERIEVLRGPQGTLYGRNTTGGAVNLISGKPTVEPGTKLLVGAGNFDQYKVRGTVNTGELGDTGVALQLSAYHLQRSGTVDNLLEGGDGNDPGSRDVNSGRLALRYDQGGSFTLDYAFDYSNRHGHSNAFQVRAMDDDVFEYLENSSLLGGATPVVSRDHLDELNLDFDGDIRDEVTGHNLTVNIELNESLTLRSLTGYRTWDNHLTSSAFDGNGGLVGLLMDPAILAPPYTAISQGIQPIDVFHTTSKNHQDQVSQEFNLIGSSGDLDYVAGLYYFREKASANNPQFLTLVIPSPTPIAVAPGVMYDSFGVALRSLLAYKHTSRSSAAFGQITWAPSALEQKLSLSGGLRYTWDEKKLEQVSTFERELTESFDEYNWMVSASYRWTDAIMTFARASTGYKAGGFNARSANNGYDPENITAYEIGVKSELFDRRVRANLVGFYSIYDDLQVSQFLAGSGGATSVTVNAGKAQYQGVEGEVAVLVADALLFEASLGYVDRDYKRFDFLDPDTNQILDISESAKFQYSASTTANLGVQYDVRLGDLGALTARLDWSYRDEVYWHPINPYNEDIADDSVGVFNARIALDDIAVGGSYLTVAAWGRNLSDESYFLSGIDFGSLGFAGVSYADPRTYGIDISLEF